MVRNFLMRAYRDDTAAISSLYAISILPLVMMAGVAFDYGRMMGLDTELQNAADQAALAAATQLDGSVGARANAITAAEAALFNQARFASDGLGRGIEINGDPANPDADDDAFEFFTGYLDDAPLGDATTDVEAKVVQVTIADRGVRYALTPVMAAFVGDVAMGRAMATLQAATCNAPPLMFCQPNIAGTDDESVEVDTSFPDADDVGKGLLLRFKSQDLKDCPPGQAGKPKVEGCDVEGDNSTDESTWAPGNFGFLNFDYASSAGNPNQTTGLNFEFLGCTGEAPTTEPGFRTPQGSALNSRLDVYPPPKVQCDSVSGDFCPSTNTRKNLVVEVNANQSCPSALNGNGGGNNGGGNNGGGNNGGGNNGGGNNGGQSYNFIDPPLGIMDPGYPKDTCFGPLGGCKVVGNSNDGWDRSGFMTANHGGADLPSSADLDGNGRITRYEVYKWEQADPSNRLKTTELGTIGTKKFCSVPHPINARPGLSPTDDQKDRRILTVAAVDCSRTADDPDSKLSGRKSPYIVKWVDLFLVRAVNTTGSEREFFTEVKGPARLAGEDSAFQALSRRKAVLLR